MRKQRSRGSSGCLTWILCIGALVFFSLAAKEYYPFLINDIRMNSLQKEVVQEEDLEKIPDKKVPKWACRKIDWKKLHKINPDITAWIHVPGTKIDYPVLHCHKWNEYLHKDYEGKESEPGSIFIQPETSEDFSDFHSIIYGHNMRSKAMFGSLHRFEDESFWKKHRKIYIYQPGKAIRSIIYSAYDCPDGSDTYKTEFQSVEEKMEWINQTISGSYFDAGISPKTEDLFITLSTCSNSGPRSSRYVVHSIVKEVINLDE